MKFERIIYNIIEEIVARRDVFWQLIEECNLPNVAYKLGGLKIILITITNGLLGNS